MPRGSSPQRPLGQPAPRWARAVTSSGNGNVGGDPLLPELYGDHGGRGVLDALARHGPSAIAFVTVDGSRRCRTA